MDKKQSSIFYLDTCSIVGNAMLLLLEKTGRKVLNSAQVEAYKYISYLNATKENFIIEEYNIIIEDLE